MGLRGVMSKRFGSVLAGVALALGILSMASPAEARHRRGHGHHVRSHVHVRHYVHIRRHHVRRATRVARASASGYLTPMSAEIVVDANTGKTIYGSHENELRHPASLTKVMTLYLLFEQLEKGRFRLDSDIPVSAHAAAQAPSKLGLRPGSTIEVEDAIKAIVTKSANDIAVAVAEAVGGTEEGFAEMMTRKARAIGMSRTNYENASGLPNPRQITTAHDLAVLGRAIQDRFPRYYRYFSARAFVYGGRSHRNHNHLLGRVEGMDGIKTGYTAASGFNLLTSVRRDGHHIVAVVLGGRTGAARDRRMASLIEEHIDDGAASRSVAAISESSEDAAPVREPVRPAIVAEPARIEPPARVEAAVARAEPIQLRPAPVAAPAPAPVRAAEAPRSLQLSVPTPPADIARADKPRPAYVSGAARIPDAGIEKTATRAAPVVVVDGSTSRRAQPVAAPTTPSSLRWAKGAQPAAHPAEVPKSGHTAVAKAEPKKVHVAETKAADTKPASVRPGWIIQIGATDDAAKANDLLSRAKGKSRAVASAQAFTEKVQKGHETLYRARFAGLQENAAESACRELKRSGFACFAMKN
ncbi:MAG: serine hydrolase [Beijerinckiaceae bacterium]